MKRFWRKKSIVVIVVLVALYAAFTAGYNIRQNPTQTQSTDKTPDILTNLDLRALLNSLNQKRATKGLTPLVENVALTDAATNRCDDMATRGYYSHTTPDGTPWYTYVKQLTTYKSAGENLEAFWADFSVDNAVNVWMASSEHKANILSPLYVNTGLASCEGTYQNKLTVFVVQEFDN